MGHVICQRTLPEYRHQGFALVLYNTLLAQLLQKGIIPVMERHRDSTITGKTGGAEKYVVDTTWRDSITGECYW